MFLCVSIEAAFPKKVEVYIDLDYLILSFGRSKELFKIEEVFSLLILVLDLISTNLRR